MSSASHKMLDIEVQSAIEELEHHLQVGSSYIGMFIRKFIITFLEVAQAAESVEAKQISLAYFK
jgi:hypothetical protein